MTGSCGPAWFKRPFVDAIFFNMARQARRVVVTGIGTINPLGNNIEDYFSALKKGESAATEITRFDASKFKCRIACEVKDYDWTKYFDRKEVRKHDLYAQYSLVAMTEAMEDAKFDFEAEQSDRMGVIWGAGIGGIRSFEEEIEGYCESEYIPRFSPFFITKMITDVVAGTVAIKYGMKGPNFVCSSACASSNNAMIDALNYVRWGYADVILTGGAEAPIAPCGLGGFSSMMALSTRNDDPKHASRPFDKDRDGFVMGEGSGALVFEEYEHAVKRGAKIYCEVLGGGLSADAHHMTAPHPEGEGAAAAMRNALQDAELKASEVDYLNTHGTSTHLGDIAELKAVAKVFAEDAYKMNISSTKSMTGHLLGGTAAIEALACVMAIRDGIVPPTINVENLDPEIDSKLNLTLGTAQEREVKVAMSNTFGFGGHNSTIIFGKL